MSEYDKACELIIQDIKRKGSRAALDGIIGLLYVSHSREEVTNMLRDAYEQSEMA